MHYKQLLTKYLKIPKTIMAVLNIGTAIILIFNYVPNFFWN